MPGLEREKVIRVPRFRFKDVGDEPNRGRAETIRYCGNLAGFSRGLLFIAPRQLDAPLGQTPAYLVMRPACHARQRRHFVSAGARDVNRLPQVARDRDLDMAVNFDLAHGL